MNCKNILLVPSFLVMFISLHAQSKWNINVQEKTFSIVSDRSFVFTGAFSVVFSETDPDLALRPAGISGVPYNVPTWKTAQGKESDLPVTKTGAAVGGDGFDSKILNSKQSGRTVTLSNAGMVFDFSPTSIAAKGDSLFLEYSANEFAGLKAIIVKGANDIHPKLTFHLTPLKAGYFSVVYTGMPSYAIGSLHEIWQPLIWQELRFPEKPFLTPAHMATIPATLVTEKNRTVGVLAASEHLPFSPLPLFINSQFGLSLRNERGLAQPRVYAPLLGGWKSKMTIGDAFHFSQYLIVENSTITQTFEMISKRHFGFKDYRSNSISSLNKTLDNIVSYAMSDYAWFVDSLKGCAYSTDVPGAVKNVSSLHPIELAMVMDDKNLFEKRGYPLLEFMLSREKFLFSLDSNQKVQNPSRKLKGPVAPISELTTLFSVFGAKNKLFVDLAKKEFDTLRERNLDSKESGSSWMNAIQLYKATKEKRYLHSAILGANNYLSERVNIRQKSFDDSYAGSFFFWPTFTNKWIDLLQLYELTNDIRYLNAAYDGARHFVMFSYMSPAIPTEDILVNKEGKAPMYWYLKAKGHRQMYYPEEKIPAWRLSEIGLTPESSGTSSGHRAIFMANHAPWLLKLGYLVKDDFLQNIAKAAIIGRYRNFPGYHINTERTSAYEKFDFPLHSHKDQSVSSFHYNHILPMASMLLDYLVTDVFVRSKGAVNFPYEYIEGYAYMQNSFYGAKKGKFCSDTNVQLWMPSGLLEADNVELNYITARKGNDFYLALSNQSKQLVNSTIQLNKNYFQQNTGALLFVWKLNKWEQVQTVTNGKFTVLVPENGLTLIKIAGVAPRAGFQDILFKEGSPVINDAAKLDVGNAKAYSFKFGSINRAFIYLEDDDTKWKQISFIYKFKDGRVVETKDLFYPFESTVDLPEVDNSVEVKIKGINVNGGEVLSSPIQLGSIK